MTNIELEKSENSSRWYKKNDLRMRVKTVGSGSILWVTLHSCNILLKLCIYDVLERIRENILLDVRIDKEWNNQRGFIIKSDYINELVNYF